MRNFVLLFELHIRPIRVHDADELHQHQQIVSFLVYTFSSPESQS